MMTSYLFVVVILTWQMRCEGLRIETCAIDDRWKITMINKIMGGDESFVRLKMSHTIVGFEFDFDLKKCINGQEPMAIYVCRRSRYSAGTKIRR